MRRLFIPLAALVFSLTACNTTPAVHTDVDTTTVKDATTSKLDVAERNKATALACVRAFSSHNVDDILKTSTADIVDYGDGSMPSVKGIDSLKPMLQKYLSAFPDLKGENLMAIAEDNHVVVIGEWSGKFTNALGNMQPTGKSYKLKDADIFTFNDQGQITEHRSIQSSKTMWMQVGVPMK